MCRTLQALFSAGIEQITVKMVPLCIRTAPVKNTQRNKIMPKQNCVLPLWAPVDVPDPLGYMLPASPSCCCPSSSGQAALGDGKRGTSHQEGRWKCHGHICHSQLAQPLGLLLLWDAGTSSLVQLRMEGKQVGKHEALKSAVMFCFLLSPCCLELWVWFREPQFFQLLC